MSLLVQTALLLATSGMVGFLMPRRKKYVNFGVGEGDLNEQK